MRNLNKLIFCLLLISYGQPGMSGEAIFFRQANLLVFRDGGTLNGLYDSENNKVSCYFLFSKNSGEDGAHREFNGYSTSNLLIFVPGDNSLSFEGRHKEFDIPGLLYTNDGEWIIRTSRPQAGCANAARVFEFDPSDIRAENYTESKKFLHEVFD